jgi:hypothetical protein
MSNPRRGEIEAVLGGRRLTLCLTLGVLAELEAAFGVSDLHGLGERFARGGLRARDLVRIVGAGVRGGGTGLSDEEIAALPLAGGLEPWMEAAAGLLQAAFGGEGTAPRPPTPQDAGP